MKIICNVLVLLIAVIPFLWSTIIYKSVKESAEKFIMSFLTIVWMLIAYVVGAMLTQKDIDSFSLLQLTKPCEYLTAKKKRCSF